MSIDARKYYINLIKERLVVWSLDDMRSLKYRIKNLLIREHWKLILDDYYDKDGEWKDKYNMWHEFIIILFNKYGEDNFKSQLIKISEIQTSTENPELNLDFVIMMLRSIVIENKMMEKSEEKSEIEKYCENYNIYYNSEAVIYCLITSLENLYIYLNLLKGIKYDKFKSQISSSAKFKNNKIPKIIRLKDVISSDMKDFIYSPDLSNFFCGSNIEVSFNYLFPNLFPNLSPIPDPDNPIISPILAINLLTFIDFFKIFALEFASDSNTPLNPIGWIKNKGHNINSRRKPLESLEYNNVLEVGPLLKGIGVQWVFNNDTTNIRNEKSNISNKDKFEYILHEWNNKVLNLLNFQEPSNETNIVLQPLRDFLNKCNINYERLQYFILMLIETTNSYMRIYIVWLLLRDNGFDISGNCINSENCPIQNLNFKTIMGDPGTLMTPFYYIWSILVGKQYNYRFDDNDNIIYKTKAQLKIEREARESKAKKKRHRNNLGETRKKKSKENPKEIPEVQKPEVQKPEVKKRKVKQTKVKLSRAVEDNINQGNKNKKKKEEIRKEKVKKKKELNESEQNAFQKSSNGNSRESENISKSYKMRSNNNAQNLNLNPNNIHS